MCIKKMSCFTGGKTKQFEFEIKQTKHTRNADEKINACSLTNQKVNMVCVVCSTLLKWLTPRWHIAEWIICILMCHKYENLRNLNRR